MTLLLLAVLADSPIPLEPGTWWEYRETYTEHRGDLDSSTEETTRFEARGSAQRPFILQTGGADPVPGPVERGPDWIRYAPWTGEEALPLPLEVGRSGPAPEAGSQGWTVEAEEEVTVPAGSFQALRCALRTWRSVSVLWIAPGVGVVRETHGPKDKRPEIERVLLRWGRPEATRPRGSYSSWRPVARSLAQVSFRVTLRLNTVRPGRESGSGQK